MRTHSITITARFEGDPLDNDDLGVIARQCASVVSSVVGNRATEWGEFCDLGLKQDTDIIIGG